MVFTQTSAVSQTTGVLVFLLYDESGPANANISGGMAVCCYLNTSCTALKQSIMKALTVYAAPRIAIMLVLGL